MQDFEDIQIGYTLDDKPKSDLPEGSLDEEDEMSPWKLNEKEMEQISLVHGKLFRDLTRAAWLEGGDIGGGGDSPAQLDGCFNLVEPFLYSYQVAAAIHKEHFHHTSKTISACIA